MYMKGRHIDQTSTRKHARNGKLKCGGIESSNPSCLLIN